MNENQRIDPTPEEENSTNLPCPSPETPHTSAEDTPTSSESKEAETPETSEPLEATEAAEVASVQQAPAEPEAADKPVYRWTYADQAAHDKAVGRGIGRRGILLYAAIMTGVFLISFGLLIAVLAIGNGQSGGGIIRPGISQIGDDDEAVEGVEQAKYSVVVIEVKTANGGGTGTGFIMTSDGYIATNHHVVDGATKIKVTFYDGTVMQAELIGSSEMDDLAVIKVSATGLPAIAFGNSDECYVGQTVYAIGTPAGPDFGWTTTRGIISFKNREVKMYDDTDGTLQKKLRLLQMDANVNPGNSGGPLINTKGEVIGVVSMKLADGYEGIGFAIPSDGAVEILEAIMKYGNADSINSSLSHKRPMLGITGVFVEGGFYYETTEDGVRLIPEEELNQYVASELLHPEVSGIYVMGFAEGMDAAAKMKAGDIITAAEGEEIESMDHLMNIINEHYAGDTITLTVYRNGEYIRVDIVLSAKPD